MKFNLRLYKNEDFDAVVILWRISREKSLPDFQLRKGHFFYEDMAYFRGHILPENQIWVVDENETGRPVALMAIKEDFIDCLYVHPEAWRKGIGQLLLDHARTLSPQRLWLYTSRSTSTPGHFTRKTASKLSNLASPPRRRVSRM